MDQDRTDRGHHGSAAAERAMQAQRILWTEVEIGGDDVRTDLAVDGRRPLSIRWQSRRDPDAEPYQLSSLANGPRGTVRGLDEVQDGSHAA
jgi:hypothetical protein